MLRHPKVLPVDATLGEVRDVLRDDHVHMVLLVAGPAPSPAPDPVGPVLVGTLVRDDVPADLADQEPARVHARLSGRTVRPDAPIGEVQDALLRAGARRLAVVDAGGRLQGLICLKWHGRGFCDDEDVQQRATGLEHPCA